MTHFHRFIVAASAVGASLAGCRERTGPRIAGRWAAAGIELVAQPPTTELLLVCSEPAHLTPGILLDSGGTIRFSTLVQPLSLTTPYRVDFLGQLVGDTLVATVTTTRGGLVVQTYTMLPNGDAGFDKVFCAL